MQSLKIELLLDGAPIQQAYYENIIDNNRVRVRYANVGELFADAVCPNVGEDIYGYHRNFQAETGPWQVRITPQSKPVVDLGLPHTSGDPPPSSLGFSTAAEIATGEAGVAGLPRFLDLGLANEEGFGQGVETNPPTVPGDDPGGTPVGPDGEQFLTGNRLKVRPWGDFRYHSRGEPQLQIRNIYDAGQQSGTWAPDFENGATQQIDLTGDTQILAPVNMLGSETFHIFIESNGNQVTFGSGIAMPGGQVPFTQGRCHLNFMLDPWGRISGVFLVNMLET